MDFLHTKTLALKLMEQHGLLDQGWTFNFDRAKSRLGQCNYSAKQITVSKYMSAYANEETLTQVLLHEIAHALLPIYGPNGKKIGHGLIWKQKAASIGYTGKRTAENPYLIANPPKRKATTRKRNAKKPAPKKRKVITPIFSVNDLISIPDGRVGRIFKVARTRYHVDIDGKLYTVPFEIASKY